MNNKIIFLIGPSGVGKTTLRKYVEGKYQNIIFIPSFTTRAPRENEKQGEDYFFVSDEEFKILINSNSLIEWENHFNHYYGISRGFCEEKLELGYSLIKEIEIGGYLQIMDRALIEKSKYFSVFVYPNNIENLIQKIKERRGDDVELRIGSILRQLNSAERCDRKIISYENDLNRLYADMDQIIEEVLLSK